MQSTIDASKQITKLLDVAQIALALVQAQKAVPVAKHAYYACLGEYRQQDHVHEGNIDPQCPESTGIIAFSKDAYAAYQASKRKVYNLTRRLHAAAKRAGE